MQLRRLNISPIQQAAGRLSNRSYTAEGIERASQTISNEIRRRKEERYQRKMQFLKDVQLDIDDANMQLLGESVDNFYEKAIDIYQSSDGDIPLDGHMEIKRMIRGINDREAQVNSLKQQYANEMQLAAKHPDQFTISQERLQEDLNKIAKGEAVATTPDPYTGYRYLSFEPIEDLESFLSGSIPAYVEWEPEVQTGKGVQTVNGAQYATNKATYGKNSGLFLRNFLQENPRLAYSAELSMQREGVKDKTPAQYLNDKYGGMFRFTSEKQTGQRLDRQGDGSGKDKDKPKIIQRKGNEWSVRDDAIKLAPGKMKYLTEQGELSEEDVKNAYVTGVKFDPTRGEYFARVTVPTESGTQQITPGMSEEERMGAVLSMVLGGSDGVKEVLVPYNYVKNEIERKWELEDFSIDRATDKSGGSSGFNLDQYKVK